MFRNRTILIATKHQKERVIAPILHIEIGVLPITSNAFDTDSSGTFSGEISRKDNALTTLRNKCILGHKATKCDLVIASEGSFGAHPTLFFAAADEEWVMLKDFKNELEIVAREISLETNFDGKTITTQLELIEFADKVHFPSHGIILKSTEKNPLKIFKEIQSKEELLKKYHELAKEYTTVFAETDMRAMFNPTRMKAIEKATRNLIEKIKKECPNCKTPGFDVISAKPGLLCKNCNWPTRSTLSHLYQCKKCNFIEEKKFPRGIQYEDPTYCDNCNP